jgi:hypothetical protein
MPLSWNEIRSNAIAFSKEWADDTSEDGEAKSFWDDFFRVFGIPRRRVAVYEKLVSKAAGKAGFIDLFWPKVLIAEHKSRGKNLDRAFGQAIDYFPGLPPSEFPQYVVVSDFARIRLTNLETDEEVEFALKDFHKHVTSFGFIAGYKARTFKEQDPVNIQAAEKLAQLHDALEKVGYSGHELEVYLVRLLFCLFADDTGIFTPRDCFDDYIRSRTSEDGSDLAAKLNELFYILNRPVEKRLTNIDEQLAAFPYVNGQLFSETLAPASFDRKMRDKLLGCCDLDWGSISPAIFGSLFQGIMDKKKRRNLGAHYTSEKNILKVIGPLFMDELWAEFDRVKTQTAKLKAFHEKLGALNFLDPACGCGNFLVISYREIRLLELEVIKKLYAKEMQQLSMDVVDKYVKVNVDQFHGIEVEEWPAQIARVAMWLIDHQMNVLVGEAFGLALVRIPLVKSANIVQGNALRTDWASVVDTSKCSYILGNPPFVGAKVMDENQRADMEAIFAGVKNAGLLDYVSAWYLKCADFIAETDVTCGLVSTNSVTQGEQPGVLWPELWRRGIQIHFAHRTFRWSNEAKGKAAVHCVIIGFGNQAPSGKKVLFDYDDVGGEAHARVVSNINPYLVDADDLVLSNRSKPLVAGVPSLGIGNKPIDGGYLLLTPTEKAALVAAEPASTALLHRWYGADEFLNGIERWVVYVGDTSPKALRSLPTVTGLLDKVRKFRLGHIDAKSGRKSKAGESSLALANTPAKFHVENIPSTEYLLIPRHSAEVRGMIPMDFVDPSIFSGDANLISADAKERHFGVLQSAMHQAWMRIICGRIKSDYRYSQGIVYNNFPWPVDATAAHKAAIEVAAKNVIEVRSQFPGSSLADLYAPLATPSALVKAHQALDRAVDAAYIPSGGKKTWSSDAERVAFLFGMYTKLDSLFAPPKPKTKAPAKKVASVPMAKAA